MHHPRASGTAGMALSDRPKPQVAILDDAVATFNSTERHWGKTVIRVRP
ncbi:MAG: hypothetical protein ACJ79K_17220 [Gemmatimonadaceae bacterium]